MQNRKNLNIVLAIILSAIWGTVGHNVWTEFDSATAVMQAIQLASEVETNPEEPYRYHADVRDPFMYYKLKPTPKATKVAKIDTVVWVPPPFRLRAIIGVGTEKSVVVEDEAGQVFVLDEGDTLGRLKIRKVLDKEVLYRYFGRDDLWSLE